MRWLILFLLGGCDIVLGLDERIDAGTTIDAPQCPESYITVETLPSRYRFVDIDDIFTSHDSRCRLDMPGRTHLAFIETLPEAFAIDQQLDLLNHDDSYWIGLTQDPAAILHTAGWTWQSGAGVDPQLWRPNEPDDEDLVENHVEDHGLVAKEGLGRLFDAPKNGMHFAICECDDVALVR